MSNLVDGCEAIGSVPGSWCVRKDHKGSKLCALSVIYRWDVFACIM